MNKGDLWLVGFPSTGGREQQGTRPALVLAEAEADIIIVVLLTSNSYALRFPHTFTVFSAPKTGLKGDSVALTFQLRALDRKRLITKVGKVEESILQTLDRQLQDLLGLA